MSNKVKTTKMNQGKQELVPKLRFPEFKDDGEWKILTLGNKNISDFIKEKTSSEELKLDRYVSTENILPDFAGVKIAAKLPTTGSFTRFKKGDILISNIRPYLKKVWQANKDGASSNDVIVIRAQSKISNLFLKFLIKNDEFINYVMEGAKGVKMPRGDVSSIKKYPIAFPDNKEQQKIADCLSSIDDLITAESEKLESIKNHKKGLMQNLFPSDGKTTPNFRFPEFKNDGEWEVKPLGKICKYSNGGGNENNVVDNGKYYLISLNSIDTEGNLKPNMKRVNHIDNSLIKNDLVMVLSDVAYGNFLGLSAIIPNNNYVLNQRMAGLRVRSNQNINIEYLRLFINNNQKYFKQKGQGSSQQNLSKPSVERFPIFLPNNPKEQQKIADCLSSIDDLITSQTQKIDTLKTHKKGLMQQIFPNIDQNHKSK